MGKGGVREGAEGKGRWAAARSSQSRPAVFPPSPPPPTPPGTHSLTNVPHCREIHSRSTSRRFGRGRRPGRESPSRFGGWRCLGRTKKGVSGGVRVVEVPRRGSLCCWEVWAELDWMHRKGREGGWWKEGIVVLLGSVGAELDWMHRDKGGGGAAGGGGRRRSRESGKYQLLVVGNRRLVGWTTPRPPLKCMAVPSLCFGCSPVQSERKFSAALGTKSARSSRTKRPDGSLAMEMSKKTMGLSDLSPFWEPSSCW